MECTLNQRLVTCFFTSLELCRLHADIVLGFKIIVNNYNLIDLKCTDYFAFDTVRRTQGHDFKLRLPKFKNKCGQKNSLCEFALHGTPYQILLLIVEHCTLLTLNY